MIEWNKRSPAEEWMDDLRCEGPTVQQTLREIETINTLLGGNEVTTNGIEKLFINKQKPDTLKIIDLGCGGGEMLKIIHHKFNHQFSGLQLIGIDANPFIVEDARNNCRDYPNIEIRVGNVLNQEVIEPQTDIITSTLFTHHFNTADLVGLFAQWKSKAGIGVVINDLHRHALAYYSIKALTTVFSKSEMVKFDAPLSVLRGFRKIELIDILNHAGISDYDLRWKWAFRWQLIF